jgi:DNA-binding response OmpR family regulator
MSNSKAILIVGRDQILLETRKQILEKAGYSVATAGSTMETEDILQNQPVNLLMLCHTLHSGQCNEVVASAKQANSKVIIVVLTAASRPCVEDADMVVHQMSTPQRLLDLVREVLP